MAYDTEKKRPGREPAWLVEIDQPKCTRTYGVAPCTATGGGDGKCCNTRFTCQDKANYNAATVTYLHSNRVLTGIPSARVDQPTSLTAVAVTCGVINLAWSLNTGSTCCGNFISIERALTADLIYSVIATASCSVGTYTDSGLSVGTSYTYRVRAVKGTRTSSYSATATAIACCGESADGAVTATDLFRMKTRFVVDPSLQSDVPATTVFRVRTRFISNPTIS